MGKRKSSQKVVKKPKVNLSTNFKCLFCNHDKTVSVVLDKSAMFGKLRCKDCGQAFSSPINNLSAAVDVYADWVDACEEIRQKQPPKEKPRRPPNPFDHGAAGGVNMTMKSNTAENELDAEGEDDDDDDLEAAVKRKNGSRKEADLDGEEEEEDDDVEDDRSRQKKRRANYDDDDDDEDD